MSDWWNNHEQGYTYVDPEEEDSNYYKEWKRRVALRTGAVLLTVIALIGVGNAKKTEIKAFFDELTSDDNPGLILDESGTGQSQEQESAPTAISITPIPEITSTPTPIIETAGVSPNTTPAVPESITYQENESLPNDVTTVQNRLKTNTQFVQDAYFTDENGARQTAQIDSYKPDTFGPYFYALSQSMFNSRERESYGLAIEHSLAPEQLLDYFRLQSLTYSQEYLKKLEGAEPINMIDFTINMLSKYHRNFIGVHESDNPAADEQNNAELNLRLQNYWRESLFPYVGVDVNSSQYFMNYADFYMENYPDLSTQITDQNGNVITINYESLLTGTLSDSDRLKALQALRDTMPEEGQRELDKNEGSKLMGIMDSVDIAWTNYSQYKYLMSGEIEATPVPTATSEPIYQVTTTSTPISETTLSAPQSTPMPTRQTETNIQQQFVNNIPIETGPNKFSDGPVWVVESDFPHTREISDQIIRPSGLTEPLFPIPSGFRGMGNIPLGAFADYQWGKHHTGTDFIAEKGSSVIAPMNMQLIQIDGDGGYNRGGEDPLGLGDHEVIGYFGDYTYTDENGNQITASLYARFGHMTQSDQLNEYVTENLGYTPNPHEAIGLWIMAGTEIGKVGNEGYSSTPHLHLEYITSIKSINGQPTDYPNAHLLTSPDNQQTGRRELAPGVRYTQGNDGRWYVQTGNVFETLAKGERNGFVPDSSRHQWPFNDHITYIGLDHRNEPTAQADIVPLSYFVQDGQVVNNRIEQFRRSLMAGVEDEHRSVQTLRVKNPAQNLRMIYRDNEKPHLWLNGASIPFDYEPEARKQYDAFIAHIHKSKKAYLKIEKDKTTGKMKISQIAYNQAVDPESPPPPKPNTRKKSVDRDDSEIGDKVLGSRKDHASLHASAVTRKYGSGWQDTEVRYKNNSRRNIRPRSNLRQKTG